MKEMSKLLMGASLVMVVSLGLVLALLIVLAAELYCSLLFRKRRLHENTTTTTTTTTTTVTASASVDTASIQETSSVPFKSVYAQGVLQAPRSLLFPSVILNKEDKPGVLLQDHEIKIEEPSSSSRHIREGIFSTISSPSPTYLPAFSPPLTNGEGSGSGGSDHLVYISNPMYDNETCGIDRIPTPFETPDTSPSKLGMSSSSSSSAEVSATSSPSSLPMTPPLAPMKKLPEQACSISLRDARSLCTSGSGSESVNGPSSSSSSGSPRTSPSW